MPILPKISVNVNLNKEYGEINTLKQLPDYRLRTTLNMAEHRFNYKWHLMTATKSRKKPVSRI